MISISSPCIPCLIPGHFFSLWLNYFTFTCLLSMSYYSSQIFNTFVLFTCLLVGAFDVLVLLTSSVTPGSHNLVSSLQTLQCELEGRLQVSFIFSLCSIGQKLEKSWLQWNEQTKLTEKLFSTSMGISFCFVCLFACFVIVVWFGFFFFFFRSIWAIPLKVAQWLHKCL